MSADASHAPRVGIPYRTKTEELTNQRGAYEKYLEAVRGAGGEPIEISLRLAADDLEVAMRKLDAIVLPGSPADVHPSLFEADSHPNGSFSDPRRESTDFALLDGAFATHKPVLAICYGIQSLNVFLGGSLVQDIPSEIRTTIQHAWPGHEGREPHHAVKLEAGSRIARLAGADEIRVNSSHHQSPLNPGRHLKIVAHAPDGVVEGVEWNGGSDWVVGVQWHPERMVADDRVAQALFADFIAAAREATASR